jgi:hypothetical protein
MSVYSSCSGIFPAISLIGDSVIVGVSLNPVKCHSIVSIFSPAKTNENDYKHRKQIYASHDMFFSGHDGNSIAC